MGETQVPSDTGARAKLSLPNASGTGARLSAPEDAGLRGLSAALMEI